jgi:hypothetical protein
MARRGFRVFPLMPNSKKPPAFMTEWQYAATTDEAKIREWFTGRYWNLGCVTGGFAVPDIDTRNGGAHPRRDPRLSVVRVERAS